MSEKFLSVQNLSEQNIRLIEENAYLKNKIPNIVLWW